MEPSLDYEKETLQKFLSFSPEPKAKKPNSGVIIFGPSKLFLFDINLILREKVTPNAPLKPLSKYLKGFSFLKILKIPTFEIYPKDYESRKIYAQKQS